MASSKDIQHSSRPINQQQRTPISGNPSSAIPTRQSTSRSHSHSLSTSLGSSHRITRRKSIINAPNNAAAIAAAVIESGDKTLAMPMPPNTRRSTAARGAKMASSLGNSLGNYPSPPNSLPSHKHNSVSSRKADRAVSTVEDDQNEDIEEEEDEDAFNKDRKRRASEGQLLAKGDKKAQGSDLRCEKCGKGYKHSSCLTKHLWEHTPEWSYTSKLLISKHQQVQLLEAASVLVQMNNDAATPPDSAKDFHSDQDSASPAASPFSGQHDGQSSADTTPPPQTEHQISESYSGSSYSSRYKRNSSSSTAFSQSIPSGASNPNYSQWTPASSAGFGSYQRQSAERRTPSAPTSALTAEAQAEEASLAAAVELLSCSFGTPRSGPVSAPDVPPVPALPAQYASLGTVAFSGCTLTPSQQSHPESYRHHSNRTDDDVQMKMEESEDSGAEDDDYDMRSRARSDEDDDGVFGRMEE